MKLRCLLFGCLILTACASTPPTYTDYDVKHSFTGYKTFSWAHTPPLIVAGNLPVSNEVEAKATAAIKKELAAKGFMFLDDSKTANFLVAYTIGARDDIEVYQSASEVYDNKDNWLWGKEYHSWYFDMVIPSEIRAGYTRGVISIDIFDNQTKTPVWHGKASKPLSDSEISSNGGSLEVAISAVLESFPPQN